MRGIFLAGALAVGLAGIGHNMPPATVDRNAIANTQCVLPRRIIDEHRRNQKLRQKRRQAKRRDRLQNYSRAKRKTRQFGTAYRPGKMFKGHRI